MSKTDKYKIIGIIVFTFVLVYIVSVIGNSFVEDNSKNTKVVVSATPVKVLHKNSVPKTVPTGFVLANSDYKNSDSKVKVVSVYLSLADNKSRDFLMFSNHSLSHYLFNNRIVLNIIPMPDRDSFSSLIFQALSEHVNKPDMDGVKVLETIVQASNQYLNSKNKTVKEQKQVICSILQKNVCKNKLFDNKNVNKFFEYKNSKHVIQAGNVLPVIVVDNTIVDSKVNVNNVDDLYDSIFK